MDGTDLAVGLLFSHGPPGWQPANTTPLPAGVPWVNESCTGNLIAPDIVLTAGHCFDVAQGEMDANPSVRMDTFYVGQGVALPNGDDDWQPAAANMKAYKVDAFARPPGYAPATSCPPSDLDIAVAHLATPVVGVTPLGLATSPPPVGATVTTIGFGVHPTSDAGAPAGVQQCCVETCVVDCTCLQSTCGCKDVSNYGGVCVCNDPTVSPAYELFVRRTASVTIAEVLASYLHQTDVSASTDLPGDSGGAVIYDGLVVGTDDCGSGCADAQTDQYFVRMDVAHDWVAAQVAMFDGDAGLVAVDAGATGSSSGSGSGSFSGGASSGSSSGGAGSGSGGRAGGSSGGTSSGASNGDAGSGDGLDFGSGGSTGCVVAGARSTGPSPGGASAWAFAVALVLVCARKARAASPE